MICACCGAEMTDEECSPAPAPALHYHREFRTCAGRTGNLRSFINSDQPADRILAQAECERLGLVYEAARQIITAEMVAEQSANEPLRARRREVKR